MQTPPSASALPGRISVAMATYNGERYLPEMLDSLASQTRLPDELVVRDDGSTDGTLAVVDDFVARAGFPVRVLPAGERLGYAQNFVTVSRACTGDLLFFADQDDVWVALLATAFGQRRILTDVLIDHRLHESNTSGWIPGPHSRAFTSPGDGSSDVEVLVDLLVKSRRLRARTETLLRVARERGQTVDPAAAGRLRRTLQANRRRYRDLRVT